MAPTALPTDESSAMKPLPYLLGPPLVLALAFTLCLGAAADAPLRFLPLPGLISVDKDTARYDAGIVDVVRTPRLERTFAVENATAQPLTITGLRGSCGCETLLLRKSGTEISTLRLAPGEQAEIQLGVQLYSGQSGAVRKYVWVDGTTAQPGEASPLATLEVDIALRQSLSFQPSYLSFGKIEAGAGSAQTLTVTLDADLLPASTPAPALPPLRSGNPAVQASPVGPPRRLETAGKAQVQQDYSVTLSPSAHAGHVSGDLWLDFPPELAEDAARLSAQKLPVSGEVAGALDALPASVFFGSLPAGKAVTRSVVITLASPQSAEALTAASPQPWLRASLDASPSSPGHRLLSITLTKQAPVGPIQEKVTVSLGSGDRLDIPIIAEMTK